MAGGNTDFTPRLARAPRTPRRPSPRPGVQNLDANLISAVLTTSAVLPGLRPGGAVINVGSIGAEYASTSYGAAEIRAGGVDSGPVRRSGPQGPDRQRDLTGVHGLDRLLPRPGLPSSGRPALIGATHNGRAGRPEDVAETAYFLASDGYMWHITGQTLHVNGGAHTTRTDSRRERRGRGHHPQDDVDADQAGAADRLAARPAVVRRSPGGRRTWPGRAGSGSTTRRAQVGIEFMVVTDGPPTGRRATMVPLTYRAAALPERGTAR